MSTLALIVVFGLAMSALALIGAVTTLMSERALARILLPLVALAAGSLLGGAFFHMLSEAVEQTGNELSVYVSFVAGFFAFFLLEQYLHWHHCHRPVSEHAPLGYLILLADGLHNFLGGLGVGRRSLSTRASGLPPGSSPPPTKSRRSSATSASSSTAAGRPAPPSPTTLPRPSRSPWAGWSPSRSPTLDVAFLLPFAAGNFVYIAAADLIPQITSPVACVAATERGLLRREKLEQTLALAAGLAALFVIAVLA